MAKKENPMSRDTLMNVLKANQNKTFVKRILEKEKYPTLDIGEGKEATHLMSWGEAGDKFVVFPLVQFDEKKKELMLNEPEEAFEKARERDNLITFDSPEQAAWFSKNYKMVWE